ncbi:MAG: HD-GYP domain-containing protein [Planctomycetota bacterium]
MTTNTTVHPLATLASALRQAEAVLVPADAGTPDPFAGDGTDLLRQLCGSRLVRSLVGRAISRATAGSAAVLEPLEGIAVIPLALPRGMVGGRYAAVAILAEAFEGETIEQLAQSASHDARIVRSILRTASSWDRRSASRLAALATALARSEGERLAGVEAGSQLSAAWEELHLLHSLSGEMVVGASPAQFVARVLAELRQTLGCRWTALSLGEQPATLLGLATGAIVGDGIDSGAARAALSRAGEAKDARVVSGDLVVAPVGRGADRIGLLAAGDRFIGDRSMSNCEKKLVETAAGHLGVFLDNARLYRDLDQMFLGALSAFVSAIDAKDPYTRGHSQRVALVSRQIAEAIGLDADEVKTVHIAGLVHDVGKIGVPEQVLRKQGRLDDDEFALIRQHPVIGWRILRDIPQFAPMLGGVRHHHERFDGAGYPDGLAGEGIPLSARIISIADTFDAMSSTRTYRAARPRRTVLEEMARHGGTQFDPALLARFLELDLRAYDAMNAAHGAGGAMKEAA